MPSSLIRVASFGAALAIACAALAGASPGTEGVASLRITANALAALRQGGYVMVLAHGPQAPLEERHEEDVAGASPDDCAAQPSLTDTGRLMASGIGKFLGRERIRIDAVLSSRTCRGVETAERIARHTHAPTVRPLDELIETTAQTPPVDKARRAAALRRLAATPPPSGANTLVVTHRANIAEAFAAGADPIRDGEMLVLHPSQDAEGRASGRLVFRVKVEDLSAYARAAKR